MVLLLLKITCRSCVGERTVLTVLTGWDKVKVQPLGEKIKWPQAHLSGGEATLSSEGHLSDGEAALSPEGHLSGGEAALSPEGHSSGGEAVLSPEGHSSGGEAALSPEGHSSGGEAVLSPEGHSSGGEAVLSPEGHSSDSEAASSLEQDHPDDRCFFNSLWHTARPLLIIKTNLLYDAALMPHIGVEAPLGERFSIGAEFMRGWWIRRDWSFCWQLAAVALEGRYWFSPLMTRHRTGGWFAGILVQAGFYDFQFNPTAGVQGEFVTAGFSGGYFCPLGGAWSLEFSLGLGCLITDYRRYTVASTHNGHELVATAPAKRLIGASYPVKAGISLQWTINHRK